jgi:sugar lactone lactonase YvrE
MVDAELLIHPGCELPEGPLWDETDNTLWWVDIVAGRLHHYDPETKRNRQFDVGRHVGTVGLRSSGGLILATVDGFATFDPETETLDFITDPEADKPGNRFNDGKPSPDGSFFAGTLAYDLSDGAAALYRLAPDMSVQKIFADVTLANGMAWNAAEDTFYFIDSLRYCIWAFDYDRVSGDVENPRVAFEVPTELGVPDGMAIDVEDKLWIAHYDGAAVRRWDPDEGKVIEEIQLPTPQVTCPTFGGADYQTLYITAAAQNYTPEQRAADPMAGAVFHIEVAVGGRAPYQFRG